jgi:hypothetical protein
MATALEVDGRRNMVSGSSPTSSRLCSTNQGKKLHPNGQPPSVEPNRSSQQRQISDVLDDKIHARQKIWEKLDDSILVVEALLETIELLKANFLPFEGYPKPEQMSPPQKAIAEGFEMKRRQGNAVLQQLKAMRGKAESTSGLVCRFLSHCSIGILHSTAPSTPVQKLTSRIVLSSCGATEQIDRRTGSPQQQNHDNPDSDYRFISTHHCPRRKSSVMRSFHFSFGLTDCISDVLLWHQNLAERIWLCQVLGHHVWHCQLPHISHLGCGTDLWLVGSQRPEGRTSTLWRMLHFGEGAVV